MKQTDRETIEVFANRSDRQVLGLAMAIALGGALMEIGASLISSLVMNRGGFPMLWGMWIPLCFLTIPPIHYLCRRIRQLERQLEAAIQQGGGRDAA